MTDSLNRARISLNHELIPNKNISKDIKETAAEKVPSSEIISKEHSDVARKNHLHDDRYLKLTDKANKAVAESGTDSSKWIHSLGAFQLFMSLLAKAQVVNGRWEFKELVVGGKNADGSGSLLMEGNTTVPGGIISSINALNKATQEVHTLAFTQDGQLIWNGNALALKNEVLGLEDTSVNSEALGSDVHFKWQNTSRGMIPFPAGGRLDLNGAINKPIGIRLPDKLSGKYGLSLVVYQTGTDEPTSAIVHVNGVYDEGSKEWYSTNAYRANNGENVTVTFGHVDEHPCIWVNNHNGTWNNPMITVMNLSVSRPDLRNIDWYATGVKLLTDQDPTNITASETKLCLAPNKEFLNIDAQSKDSAKLNGNHSDVNNEANTVVVRDSKGVVVVTSVKAEKAVLSNNTSSAVLANKEITVRDKDTGELDFMSMTLLEKWLPKASLTRVGLVSLSNATEGTRENVAATEAALGSVFKQTKRICIMNPSSGLTLHRNAAKTVLVWERDENVTLTLGDDFIEGDVVVLHRLYAPNSNLSFTSSLPMRVYFPGVGPVEENSHFVRGTCKVVLERAEGAWLISVQTG